MTLLAWGCPPAAIVAAFGLDARTVAAWQRHAGALVGPVYNFCTPHQSLSGQTPAQAAGLTHHCWGVAEVLG